MYEGYITDVKGIKVGHAEDIKGGTGVTVIIPPSGNSCAVEVRGSAPGTRETDLLNPVNTVESVNALILSGGSAYGLNASSGVMQALEEDGLGLDVGVGIVPIVPQAVLFDLAYKDYKCRPDSNMGKLAYKNAGINENRQGIVGAGTGATVGKILGMDKSMKSGLGSASICQRNLVVSAMVAVNAFGDIYDYEKGKQIAGPIDDGKIIKTVDVMGKIINNFSDLADKNTTIGIVSTNAKFDKTKLTKIAQMTHDGFARSINPVHTGFDGDTIFALSTNEIEADLNMVGVMAANAMSRAIANAIYATNKKESIDLI
ncbi:P1 family peptidase [Anaerococcus sp.]|uniref:P1 family peptidase n=1 Tax=Anaerococcus sp. TaxID=1872515 RepID=UPI0028FF04AD|nr:P1 family peptidase [Anaerococcus sp.]MDU1828498.1 P1 family peptidase [Anaerococcus sp.]MDU1864761.1 P1 family peptidase [Anaerococcus sp.]